jgi:hypothetical protein
MWRNAIDRLASGTVVFGYDWARRAEVRLYLERISSSCRDRDDDDKDDDDDDKDDEGDVALAVSPPPSLPPPPAEAARLYCRNSIDG